MIKKVRRSFLCAALAAAGFWAGPAPAAPKAVLKAPLAEVKPADGKADAAYRDAKEAYAKLKADPARRKFRHHWQNVARRFEAVASRFDKSERAAEALYNAAELNQELSRFSQNAEDLAAAVHDYERLLEKWPKHRLSDDAAYALGRIKADRLGDPSGARKALKVAAAGGGDKAPEAKALLAALPSEPAPREKPGKEPTRKDDDDAAPARHAAIEKPKESRLSDAVAEAIRRVGRPAEAPAADRPAPERAATNDRAASERPTAERSTPERPATERPAPERSGPERQGRRAPPLREEEDAVPESAAGDATVEGADTPVLATLTEKLRDVRVGQPASEADDALARARFKKFSKEQAASDITLAEQLGLKVRRVVIDAGHGGHDTGAIGPTGVLEKDVSLSIALKLKARLEKAGLEVVLTRDDDTYVKLEDRTAFANRHKGDLFISVHCNAAQSHKMRGIETYTLNTSSDRYAIRLAARENSTSEKGVSDLQFILADLATKANTEESDRLAGGVQKTLVRALKTKHPAVKDLGQKEALFFVLLGARMPAILVETSFLSHPEEEKLLSSKDYQEDVATAIADGVQGFLDERARLARVD